MSITPTWHHGQVWWVMAASGLTQWVWCWTELWNTASVVGTIFHQDLRQFVQNSDNQDWTTEKLRKKQVQCGNRQERGFKTSVDVNLILKLDSFCIDTVPIKNRHAFLMLLQGNALNFCQWASLGNTTVSYPHADMKPSDISKSNRRKVMKFTDHIHAPYRMNPIWAVHELSSSASLQVVKGIVKDIYLKKQIL